MLISIKGATRVNTRKIAKAISKGPGIDDKRRIIKFSDVFRRVRNKCCRKTEEQSFQSVKFRRKSFTSLRRILVGKQVKKDSERQVIEESCGIFEG